MHVGSFFFPLFSPPLHLGSFGLGFDGVNRAEYIVANHSPLHVCALETGRVVPSKDIICRGN